MSDPSKEKGSHESFLGSWSLDMLIPLGDREPHGLLARWDDLSAHQLPAAVRQVALSQGSDPDKVLYALTDPAVISDSVALLIEQLRAEATEAFGTKSAEISLARAGLLSEIVPTLEELGIELEITRERVRQVEKPLQPVASSTIRWDTPLALSLGAWFALHPGLPLTDVELLNLGRSAAASRCLALTLRALDVPHIDWQADIWIEREDARRALEVLVSRGLLHLGHTARGWNEAAEAIARGLPGIERSLDLSGTLRRIGRARDIGPGIDGRIVQGRSRQLRRVARKVVTYLSFRASPISVAGLADVIRQGLPPFEVFAKPDVGADWVEECVLSLPDSLEVDSEGNISLPPHLAKNGPPGRVGTLYDIILASGEPMRMQDLCDKAAASGMSRNQVGMLIHSRRAACLFMLKRGIVGLVGRDEDSDPDSYTAVNPSRGRAFLRPGKGIDPDDEGALLADLKVRRSLHEQGLGIPWPFSLVALDPDARLMIDGKVLPIWVRGNGALDIDELEPNSLVRVRLRRRPRSNGCSLEIRNYDKWPAADSLDEDQVPQGSRYPVGMPTKGNKPGWINKFLQDQAETAFSSPQEVLAALPSALTRRRRLYCLHGLIALGLLQKRNRGWVTAPDTLIPAALTDVFSKCASDSTVYPLLDDRERAAATWLVRAGWLTPNLGWSIVRVNDLSAEEDRDLDIDVGQGQSDRPSAKEAALMKVLETAHQAEDHILHPYGSDPLSQTLDFARRYLTAVGFTRYGAIKETLREDDHSVLEFNSLGEPPCAGIWVLRPLGTPIRPHDLEVAHQYAEQAGAVTWAACNGIALRGCIHSTSFEVRFQDFSKEEGILDALMALSPDETSPQET